VSPHAPPGPATARGSRHPERLNTVTPEVYEETVTIVAATTAYGRPGIDLLARQIAELKDGDPLGPVTVVVPSNHAAVAARRALAANDRGIVNVTFLTLHRLAERLGGPALARAGRRPVSVPVIAAAVRAVLAADPGVFAPVADHPATEQALVAAHRELADARDDALDDVAAASERAGDVVRIHRAVKARLGGDWFDEADLLAAARDAVRAHGREVAADLGPVVLHQLRDLTAAAAELVGALAGATAVRADVALTGDRDADRAVIAAHERAGIDVPPAAHDHRPPCATAIISASDPDDEVRAAIRRVTTWMHEGVALGRIALLYGSGDPYARLLHEQLAAAGIPFNGAPIRAIGDLLLGRTLRALLALPERDYRRPDVLGVLANAPLVGDDGHAVHSRRWETISRDAGVVDGDDWDVRLTHYAAEQRRRAEKDEGDERDWLAERRRRDADEAEALRSFVARLRADVDRGTTLTTWTDLVAWTHDLIDTYVGDPGRRHAWPDDEQDAAHRVEAAIDGLAGLDALHALHALHADGAPPPPTSDVFRRTLDGELESSLRRHGRLGDGVLVGPVSMAPGLVLDGVVVLGMAEGAFPPRRLEDCLLPDRERARANGELTLRAHRVDDDRRNLLAAVAAVAPDGHAVLCHPRGDLRRNGERPASRWLLADAADLACVDVVRAADLRDHEGEPWFEHVASFAGGLARASVQTSEQALRLAAIARADGDERGHALLTGDTTLAAARTVVTSRRSAAFTRFDGNVTSVAGELADIGTMSASRLQTWAKCPHAFFLQHVLGVEPVSEPERRIAIDPLDTGSLVHEILDTFVKQALDEGRTVDRWTDADRARLHRIAAACFADAEARGITGRPLLWARDRAEILGDLVRFVDADNERMRDDGVVPVSTEREFRDVVVTLPSGRTLHLRGSVDRIDRAADGSLVVLDYKTGSASRYEKLSAADPHRGGTLLQLYVYAVAARHALGTDAPVWAGYWFNTARRNFRRIGYDVTPEIEAEVGRAIDVIVDGITSGVFPARPAEKPAWTHVDCWFCAPDGLSSTERRREWDRKRGAHELRAYAALAEGEVSDE
jgi:RecB family exonuclease